MYNAGATITDCAGAFGINEATARKALRQVSVDIRVRGFTLRRDFTDAEREELLSLYKGGMALQPLAEHFKAGYQTVLRELRDNGVYAPGKRRKGRYTTQGGYIVLEPERGVRILEHRAVMAEMLGRPLFDHETVHHKNGDRADNRPTNLELRVGRHGKGATESHCATCTCFEGAP